MQRNGSRIVGKSDAKYEMEEVIKTKRQHVAKRVSIWEKKLEESWTAIQRNGGKNCVGYMEEMRQGTIWNIIRI